MVAPGDVTTTGRCVDAHDGSLIVVKITQISESSRAIGIIIENSQLVPACSASEDQRVIFVFGDTGRKAVATLWEGCIRRIERNLLDDFKHGDRVHS